MNKDFDYEVCGLGTNISGYPGGFTPTISKIIVQTLVRYPNAKILHLFSGASLIGDERIDLERPEATKRQDVLDFIRTDDREWDFVILDPPYEIKRVSKIREYAKSSAIAPDVILRRELEQYFQKQAVNIMWLDMCAPLPAGFKRVKLWFLFPGGYRTVRILSWLENVGNADLARRRIAGIHFQEEIWE